MSISPDRLLEAIVQKDEGAVRRLLIRARREDWLFKEEHWPADEIVQVRSLDMLDAVLAYMAPKAGVAGYARALEEDWKEGVDRLDASLCAQAQVLETKCRHAALDKAARAGWLRAIDRMLIEHPYLLNLRSDTNPLVSAIQTRQEAAVHRMLEADVHPSLLNGALWHAVVTDQPTLLPALWPNATNYDRGNALLHMVRNGQDEALAWTLAHLSPSLDELSVSWGENGVKRNNNEIILVEGVKQGRTDLVMRLLPLVDPLANQSLLLRAAVEHDQPDLIAHLLPLSDAQAARHAWLHQRPPQWPMVDRLGLHLSPEQQAKWHNQPDRLPGLTAVRRAAQTLQQSPGPDHAPRRRLRS